jgi:hypothetical protein
MTRVPAYSGLMIVVVVVVDTQFLQTYVKAHMASDELHTECVKKTGLISKK